MSIIRFCSSLLSILLPVFLITVITVHSYAHNQQSNVKPRLKVELESLKSRLTEMQLQQVNCTVRCVPSTLLEDVKQHVTAITRLASNEKKIFSSVGNITLDNLLLDLQRPTLASTALQTKLIGYISELEEHLRQLDAYHQQELQHQQIKNTRALVALLALQLLCLVIVVGSNRAYSRNLKLQLGAIKHSLRRLHQFTLSEKNALSGQAGNLEELGKEERAITNAFTELTTTTRKANEEQDLYKQLYGFIGYEIRSITNNIQGNLKLLVQEADENSLTLAKNVSSSAETLIDLASNYNSLLSAGASDSGDSINLNQLISSLSITLNHRLRENDCEFDCLVQTEVPLEINGNYTRLFWSLLITLSNLVQASKNTSNLLLVRSHNSSNIENVRLFFDFILLDSKEDKISRLIGTQWSSLPNPPVTNKSALKLLPDRFNVQARWLVTDNAKALSFCFDGTPTNYFNPDRLFTNKTCLVCGADILHTSVLVKSLQDLHISVDVVRSPNELFKQVGASSTFDVIIISDTMKGIKLASFCKTLKSRLAKIGHTKLVMSVSNPEADEGGYTSVDKIYTHPFTTYELAQKLNDIFSELTDSEEEKQPILVVEDDKIQQFILTQILEMQDFQSVGVFDGLSAVEQYQQANFNIIFMDCVLPGIDGLEATRRIRSIENQHELPNATIIGATALTSRDEHKACIDAGMDYVISKPYNADQIAKVIRKYAALQKIS